MRVCEQRHYTPILMATLRHNAVAASTMLRAGAVTDIVTVGSTHVTRVN
jgi:hypothetical protein